MVQKTDFVIKKSTEQEKNYIDYAISEVNVNAVPYTQKNNPIDLSHVIKDSKGTILGGINAVLYNWNILYIDILWVKENYRNKGIGADLINRVEVEAKKYNCSLIHLDTFDFQAKDFYIKMGFEIFGVLEGCPHGHKRFYLKKNNMMVLDEILGHG